MTRKAYLTDPLIFDFTATIVSNELQDDGTSHIILDQTYFYPTGGGQAHDRGKLAGLTVLDVRKAGENIVHVVDGNTDAYSVRGFVDDTYRLRLMQAHTGQHLLSATFVEILKGETVAVKMSAESPSTVDIDLPDITPQQIRDIEIVANRVMTENREVKSYFLKADEIPDGLLRRQLKTDVITGDVRIVEIVDWDVSACAGTHFPTTGMLGMLKILKVERHKGGVRIYFVVGDLALETFQQSYAVLDTVTTRLSTGIDDLADNIEKLVTERNDLNKTVAAQREKLLSYEADDLRATAQDHNGTSLITMHFEDRPAAEVKLLATLLTETPNTAVLCVNQQGEAATLVVASSADDIHAGNTVRAWLAQYDGRGGGNDRYAQGMSKTAFTAGSNHTPTSILATGQSVMTA